MSANLSSPTSVIEVNHKNFGDLYQAKETAENELANAKERIKQLAEENSAIREQAQQTISEVQQDYDRKMKSWGITCALQTLGLFKEHAETPSFELVAELAAKFEQYATGKVSAQ